MKELIEKMYESEASPERKLCLLAQFCGDMQAAEDLWNRSIRSTQWLTEAILECPDLFAEALRRSTEVPVMMSLTPSSGHYYKKLAEHLKKHCLGTDSGISTGENKRWGGKGQPAALAYCTFTTIQILKGRTSSDGFALSLASIIRARHSIERPPKRAANLVVIEPREDTLLERAIKLPGFGQNSVERWCDLCIDILDATIEPGLRPGKRGRRKKGFDDADNLRNGKKKALRDQIRARLRDIVAAPDKRH